MDTPEQVAEDEARYNQFFDAVAESKSTGSTDLDTLLNQGLYGKKLPKALKGQKAADAFQSAFELIGGVPRLALWADKNPSAFFALYSKLIPSTIQAQVDTTLRVELKYSNPAFNTAHEVDDLPSVERLQ